MAAVAYRKRACLSAALLCLLSGLCPATGSAQTPAATAAETTAPRCTTAEFRQFDFWIGDWEVRTADGQLAGHNDIRRVSGGCGLLESWRGTGGGTGVSVNTYDQGLGHWTQRWVGAGATLWLVGGLENGAMVLTGTSPRDTPNGAVLDRITWTALPDGRVRQVWETSADGGGTWTTLFDGFYSRR